MKVVLFCGGQGTRLRDYSEQIPKPLVPVGGRPILWHIMRYYAAFGHKDFIICLGYKGDVIKKYFLDYDERLTNNFIIERGGVNTRLLEHDIRDWQITFVDTGQTTNIGGRLLRVRDHLEGEDMFLANYGDTLTGMDLNKMIAKFKETDAVAGFCCIRPPYTFHYVHFGETGQVSEMVPVQDSEMWMNGGYFTLRPGIFDAFGEGEEMVVEGFERLIKKGRLYAHRHEGFWMPMDTFREKQALDDMFAAGNIPWQIEPKG